MLLVLLFVQVLFVLLLLLFVSILVQHHENKKNLYKYIDVTYYFDNIKQYDWK